MGLKPSVSYRLGLVMLGMGLPPQLLAGMVLVEASAGGTASNLICHLARGYVALSITMTAVSTVAAPLCTPRRTLLHAGRGVDVPALKHFQPGARFSIWHKLTGSALAAYGSRCTA